MYDFTQSPAEQLEQRETRERETHLESGGHEFLPSFLLLPYLPPPALGIPFSGEAPLPPALAVWWPMFAVCYPAGRC